MGSKYTKSEFAAHGTCPVAACRPISVIRNSGQFEANVVFFLNVTMHSRLLHSVRDYFFTFYFGDV